MVTIVFMLMNQIANAYFEMKVLLASLLITIVGGVLTMFLGATVSAMNFGLLTLLVIAYLINAVFTIPSSLPTEEQRSYHKNMFLHLLATGIVGAVVFHSVSQFGTPSMIEGAIWSVLTVPVFMLMLLNTSREIIFYSRSIYLKLGQRKQQKRMDAHDAWLEKASLKFDAWEFQHNREKRQSSSE